jgi:hypothetical protein
MDRELHSACTLAFMLWIKNYIRPVPLRLCYGSWIKLGLYPCVYVMDHELYSACTLAFMLWIKNYIRPLPLRLCYGSWIILGLCPYVYIMDRELYSGDTLPVYYEWWSSILAGDACCKLRTVDYFPETLYFACVLWILRRLNAGGNSYVYCGMQSRY